ncbi:MAG: sigma-70 family RNA polymerase sigma factor [Acidimicrobiales bacterium]
MDALSRLAIDARAGDERSLESFVDAAYHPVWHLCATLVDGDSADDLAQETFIRAVAALPRFRGESSARTWLLSIARHVCLDEVRSRVRRRRRDSAIVFSARLQSTVVTDCGEESALRDLLLEVHPERREAFALTQLSGLTYSEAADVCGCPIGTIRSRVARARTELLELLDRAEDRAEEGSGAGVGPFATGSGSG